MIPAGGSGKITAKVRTSTNQHGSFTKGITVHTDVAGAEDLRLSFSFSVVAPILVLPNPNLVLMGVEKEEVQARLVLHRSDGKPLQLSDVHSTLPIKLDLEVRPPSSAELADARLGAQQGDLVLEATLPPQPEVARQGGEVMITTNHPEQPRLELPITVWTRPAITVSPAKLSLRLSGGGSPQRAAPLRLSSSARRPFKITALEVSRPDLLQVEVDSEVPKLYHLVRVNLKEGVDPGAVRDVVQATLKLATSDPARPSLEIPLAVVPAPASTLPAPAPTGTPGP